MRLTTRVDRPLMMQLTVASQQRWSGKLQPILQQTACHCMCMVVKTMFAGN